MTAIIDFSSLTLNTEEARETKDLVFEDVFVKPNQLSDVHDIQTGIEMDKFIPILGNLPAVGQLDPGSCNNNDSDVQIPTSQKTWEPKLISFRLIHCQDQIPTLLKFWKKSRIAANTWEEVDNEMMAYITDKTEDAVYESILRISSLADTDYSPFGDVAGNEVGTVGTDKTLFNMLDGLWKQIFTDQAGAQLAYRHTITENAELTKAAQLALAATTSIDAMRATYNNIDARAFKGNSLGYQMTRTMWNNYVDYLEDKSVVFTLQETQDGVSKMAYRGIPITVRYDWDENINTFFDNGTVLNFPHRLILTKLTNIPVGTSDTESLNLLKSHFDMTTEKHYIKSAYKLDVKMLLEYELASAY